MSKKNQIRWQGLLNFSSLALRFPFLGRYLIKRRKLGTSHYLLLCDLLFLLLPLRAPIRDRVVFHFFREFSQPNRVQRRLSVTAGVHHPAGSHGFRSCAVGRLIIFLFVLVQCRLSNRLGAGHRTIRSMIDSVALPFSTEGQLGCVEVGRRFLLRRGS